MAVRASWCWSICGADTMLGLITLAFPKPCGFAAALGRRCRVAHNSTGPTSVSIDLELKKGSCRSGGRSVRQGNTGGEATLGVRRTFSGEAIRPLTLIVAPQPPQKRAHQK